VCSHQDSRGISQPENAFVSHLTENRTSERERERERDEELMHLTAESTREESGGLVTQTASRLQDKGNEKQARKDLRVTEEERK